MKYYVQRQNTEYGPYTLADLQRYLAQGNVLLTDLARSEGMTEWVPVSQVIGNVPIPVPTPPMQSAAAAGAGGTAYGGGTVYGGAGTIYGAPAQPVNTVPAPIDFHWALVLLITVFSFGLFGAAWLIVEAAFVKKIKPESKSLLFVILGVAGVYGGRFLGVMLVAVSPADPNPIWSLFVLVGLVLYLVGIFKMKSDLEEHYNSVEPINLELSGVMTFFFNVYYFQYHLSRIAKWKKSGVLQP